MTGPEYFALQQDTVEYYQANYWLLGAAASLHLFRWSVTFSRTAWGTASFHLFRRSVTFSRTASFHLFRRSVTFSRTAWGTHLLPVFSVSLCLICLVQHLSSTTSRYILLVKFRNNNKFIGLLIAPSFHNSSGILLMTISRNMINNCSFMGD